MPACCLKNFVIIFHELCYACPIKMGGTDMRQREFLEELKKLPAAERLATIEAALHLLYDDLRQTKEPSTKMKRKRQLAEAAKALLPDYSTDDELTAFKALDHEDFHAAR
jgi:hypothetical protein